MEEVDLTKLPLWYNIYSKLYRSLREDGVTKLYMASRFVPHDTSITTLTTLDQFYQQLHICEYWQCEDIPSSLLEYAMQNVDKLFDLNYIHHVSPKFGVLFEIILLQPQTEWCQCFVEAGHLIGVKLARWNQGHLAKDLCSFTTDRHVLEYLWMCGCEWSSRITENLAKAGELETLQWAIEKGCPYDERMEYEAAIHGHLSILQYTEQFGFDSPFHKSAMLNDTTGDGHYDTMKYLIDRGDPWDFHAFIRSFQTSNVKILEYLWLKGSEKWNSICGNHLFKTQHRNVLEYMAGIGFDKLQLREENLKRDVSLVGREFIHRYKLIGNM